jgi:hypothetical protein
MGRMRTRRIGFVGHARRTGIPLLSSGAVGDIPKSLSWPNMLSDLVKERERRMREAGGTLRASAGRSYVPDTDHEKVQSHTPSHFSLSGRET